MSSASVHTGSVVWLVLLLLWPLSVQAQDTRPDPLAVTLTISAGALAGADLAMTMRCVGAGTCCEQGPLLKPLADHPVAFGAVKAGAMTAMLLAVYHWTRPHTRERYAGLALIVASQAVIVALNARHGG